MLPASGPVPRGTPTAPTNCLSGLQFKSSFLFLFMPSSQPPPATVQVDSLLDNKVRNILWEQIIDTSLLIQRYFDAVLS